MQLLSIMQVNIPQNGSTLLKNFYVIYVDDSLPDLYVDDSASGFDTVFAAYDFYLKVKSMMHDAGFDLRKWASNTSELMKKIERNETHDFTPTGKNSTRKVLKE